MSTNINTCFIEPDGTDASQEFVEKSYLIDVYPNLIGPAKAPGLWLQGPNPAGQLGDNSRTTRTSPVQTVAFGTNWKQVSAVECLTAAIKTDGSLWLWGAGDCGTLGNNNVTNRSSPVQTVSGGTNWKQVSLVRPSSILDNHSAAAIKCDGSLWTWGQNNVGQLGNNTVLAQSSPIQTVSGGTDWKQVSAGVYNMSAIKTNGTLWLWGCNCRGRLGNSSVVNQSSPVQTVSGGTNWKQVSLGPCHSAAIKTDGSLWLWGANAIGELGIDSVLFRSSPVQTVSGGTNWKQVSLGSSISIAIKTDGTLWTWGLPSLVDTDSANNFSSPVQATTGGTNWKKIETATNISRCAAAIKTDGTLWTWSSTWIPEQVSGSQWKDFSQSGVHWAAIKEQGDW